jgi:transposase InsO family protein
VRKWLARFGSEGVAGLQNRSSAPHLVANKLPAPWLTMAVRLRRDYRMSGKEITERLQLPRSSIASQLRRLRLGWLAALEPGEPVRRPTAHTQASSSTSIPRSSPASGGLPTHHRRPARTARAGWEFVHVAIDDASRLAYVEVMRDEKRQSMTGFLAPRAALVPSPRHPGRGVMTFNGSGYVWRRFRKACLMLQLRHLGTRPYTPKTNGEAERFLQTFLREWADALPNRSATTERDQR